jgi:hypothetical protein
MSHALGAVRRMLRNQNMDRPVDATPALAWAELYRRCDADRFTFDTTRELEPLTIRRRGKVHGRARRARGARRA